MIDKYMAQAEEWKEQWTKLHDADPFKHAVEMERLEQLIMETLREDRCDPGGRGDPRWGFCVKTMGKKVEMVARIICEGAGHDPDHLEPGDVHGVDAVVRGEPCFRFWRQYAKTARKVINALNK